MLINFNYRRLSSFFHILTFLDVFYSVIRAAESSFIPGIVYIKQISRLSFEDRSSEKALCVSSTNRKDIFRVILLVSDPSTAVMMLAIGRNGGLATFNTASDHNFGQRLGSSDFTTVAVACLSSANAIKGDSLLFVPTDGLDRFVEGAWPHFLSRSASEHGADVVVTFERHDSIHELTIASNGTRYTFADKHFMCAGQEVSDNNKLVLLAR